MIEGNAIRCVAEHYSALGYVVVSVEEDNVGWDLEARLGPELLRLEVKGLSSSTIRVGLTPNEYRQMKANLDTYRLCVVTRATQRETCSLDVFAYHHHLKQWVAPRGVSLSITEVTSADITITDTPETNTSGGGLASKLRSVLSSKSK